MPQSTSAVLTHLLERRTVPAARLVAPAPAPHEIDTMLTAAIRVPDHGKLTPWRFIVVGDEQRNALSTRLLDLWRKANPGATESAVAAERAKREAAPLLIVVVSRAGEHPKIPEWEQTLSAGAACMNLVHAAHAHGYGAQWLTGWVAYDEAAKRIMGVSADERIAGIVHVGTPAEAPAPRDRPDVETVTTRWHA